MNWLKIHHGISSDRKWPVIAKRAGTNAAAVLSIWTCLLDHASQHRTRGSVEGFDVESVADFLGLDEPVVEAVLHEMRARNLIDGSDHLSKWEERQSDGVSTPRVRAHREKKRAEAAAEHDATAETNGTVSRVSETPETTEEKRGEEKREDESRGQAPALKTPNVNPLATDPASGARSLPKSTGSLVEAIEAPADPKAGLTDADRAKVQALVAAVTPSIKPRPRRTRSGEATPTAFVWEAYRDAYLDRYGVEPVRNATVNGQLASMVARIGADEAPSVAAFYVAHNLAFYVRCSHAVGPLVRDCEGLRTQWARGKQITAAAASQADRTQTNFDAFAPLLAAARARSQGE